MGRIRQNTTVTDSVVAGTGSGCNTLFVARNIPIPGHRENDIILQFAEHLRDSGVSVSMVYQAEWLPVPARWLSGIKRSIASLLSPFDAQGIPVHVLRYLRLPGLQLSYALAKWFRGGQFDQSPTWVHAHYVLPDGVMARSLGRRFNCPYAVTVRQGDLRKWHSLWRISPLRHQFKQVLRDASVVFAPSPTIQTALAELGTESVLLPHAVTLPASNTPRLTSTGGLRVFAAAALLPLKQLDWLIESLPLLPEITELVIAGEGPERDALSAHVERLHVAERVRFLGAVSRVEVLEHMAECDIYALPSVSETFGLSYLEAAASGCAVLACRHTGVHGCFEEDQEMVFCEPNRVDAIAALTRLCRDHALRARVAAGGRRRVELDYQWPRVITKYLDALGAL